MPITVRAAFARGTHVLRRVAALTAFTALAGTMLGVAQPARAEGGIRIAEQFGVVYLMLTLKRLCLRPCDATGRLVRSHGR